MSKLSNQKLKIVYLMKILFERTDEMHKITMAEIIKALEEYGVSAERKSIYKDIETLQSYGVDVIGLREGKNYLYYVGSRVFELAELKLLVDSVQSAKFITERKSKELIKKLEKFASKHEAKKLQRQVSIEGRVKTINESIYYNVDKIHTAIAKNSKITFRYFRWNVDKQLELRHNGDLYEVSPWCLFWDDENYYLIAYDSKEKKVKHFRVDKMTNIELNNEEREGKDIFKKFDVSRFSKKTFGMYGGDEERVRMECDNSLIGVMIDRFGKEVAIAPLDAKRFVVNVDVAVSDQFFAWVIGLGKNVKIIGPDSVVKKMNEVVDRLIEQYKDLESN